MHIPAKHDALPLQALPAQHICPIPPQGGGALHVFAVVLLGGYLGWSLRKLRQLERIQKGPSISGLPPKQ